MVRRAFTLIELLTVMAILAILAGTILAVVGPVRNAVRRAKTESILAVVRVALETSAASRGGALAPVPHPLAGTAAPRSIFRRGATTLATTGEALWVEDPAWVAALGTAMCTSADLFAGRGTEGDVPTLYAVDRSRLSVLGATNCRVIEHRRLPRPVGRWDADRNGITDLPYTAAQLPDRDHLVSGGFTVRVTDGGSGFTMPPTVTISGSGSGAVAEAILGERAGGSADKVVAITVTSFGSGWTADPTVTANGVTAVGRLWDEGAQRAALDAAIGEAGRDQLAELGALQTSPETPPASELLCGDLLWSPPTPPAETSFAPGHLRDGAVWRRYRLRGPALYDAWGGEILVSALGNGGWRVESAGRDGCFRWHPGPDGVFQTAVDATSAAGDDRDASSDNISAQVVK
jgi:prepilin-type N-terminal cleavage/methylation domain-containing protein